VLWESVGGNGVTVLTTVAPIFQTGDRELFPCLFRPDRTVSELFCLLKSRIRVADKIHCSTRDLVQKRTGAGWTRIRTQTQAQAWTRAGGGGGGSARGHGFPLGVVWFQGSGWK